MDDKVTDAMTPNTPCGQGVCFKYEECLQWENCTAHFKRRRQAQEAPKAESQSAENIVDEISDLLEHEQYQRSVSLIKDSFSAQRQAGREERCDNCDRDSAINAFRMDELDAVMMSVDKWLSGQALRNNPATRAADAREVALKAIEAVATAQAKRYAEAVAAAKKYRMNNDAYEEFLYGEELDKALSALDEAT